MIVSNANALVQCRRLRGWSQALLAEKSAVSRTEVSAIETGRLVPSVAVALRLANALGRSEEHTSELQSLRHLVCRLLLQTKIVPCLGEQRPEGNMAWQILIHPFNGAS